MKVLQEGEKLSRNMLTNTQYVAMVTENLKTFKSFHSSLQTLPRYIREYTVDFTAYKTNKKQN
jgi:hypothetical protein